MTLHRNPLGSSWLFTFSLPIPLDDIDFGWKGYILQPHILTAILKYTLLKIISIYGLNVEPAEVLFYTFLLEWKQKTKTRKLVYNLSIFLAMFESSTLESLDVFNIQVYSSKYVLDWSNVLTVNGIISELLSVMRNLQVKNRLFKFRFVFQLS